MIYTTTVSARFCRRDYAHLSIPLRDRPLLAREALLTGRRTCLFSCVFPWIISWYENVNLPGVPALFAKPIQ